LPQSHTISTVVRRPWVGGLSLFTVLLCCLDPGRIPGLRASSIGNEVKTLFGPLVRKVGTQGTGWVGAWGGESTYLKRRVSCGLGLG
jgi:hypothetical protein